MAVRREVTFEAGMGFFLFFSLQIGEAITCREGNDDSRNRRKKSLSNILE